MVKTVNNARAEEDNGVRVCVLPCMKRGLEVPR